MNNLKENGLMYLIIVSFIGCVGCISAQWIQIFQYQFTPHQILHHRVYHMHTIQRQELDNAQPAHYVVRQNLQHRQTTPNNSIEQEIADVFGGESQLAIAIAKAESGLNPHAVNYNYNGTRDLGVFQLNDCHGWSDEIRFDWKRNIQLAKELRDRKGWGEWVTYNNGAYRNHIGG